MKRFTIIIFLFFSSFSLFSQENKQISIVYLHDGSMIKGFVIEDHTLDLVNIKIIDGTVLSISLKTVKSIIKLKENIEILKNGKYVQTKGVYKLISMGTLTGWRVDEQDYIVWGFSLINLAAGYQFNQFINVGGGIGMDIYDKEYFPVYADFRGYILNKGVSPYYAFQLGYGFSTDIFNNVSINESYSGGVMLHPSIGLRFASYKNTKFIMEAGYKFQYDKRTNEFRGWVDKMVYKRLSIKFGVLF